MLKRAKRMAHGHLVRPVHLLLEEKEEQKNPFRKEKSRMNRMARNPKSTLRTKITFLSMNPISIRDRLHQGKNWKIWRRRWRPSKPSSTAQSTDLSSTLKKHPPNPFFSLLAIFPTSLPKKTIFLRSSIKQNKMQF